MAWRQLADIAAGIDENHRSRGLDIIRHIKLYMESNVVATISFDLILNVAVFIRTNQKYIGIDKSHELIVSLLMLISYLYLYLSVRLFNIY